MARPKSDDKRIAILSAAAKVFVERGLAASTLSISQEAGVAEGTLFTYFKTKDELINALYKQTKTEMADAIMSDFPHRKPFKSKVEHIWNRFIDWGIKNPTDQMLLSQLKLCDRVTAETQQAGMRPFEEIMKLSQQAMEQQLIHELPHEFIGAMLDSIAQTTIQFMLAEPKKRGTVPPIWF